MLTQVTSLSIFQDLCKAWNRYTSEDINEYFRIPLNVCGIDSVEDINTADEWFDFIMACKLSGVEYLAAKRAFMKLYEIE